MKIIPDIHYNFLRCDSSLFKYWVAKWINLIGVVSFHETKAIEKIPIKNKIKQ